MVTKLWTVKLSTYIMLLKYILDKIIANIEKSFYEIESHTQILRVNLQVILKIYKILKLELMRCMSFYN